MEKYLWNAIWWIILITGVMAIPSVLHIQRALPVTGQVMDIRDFDGREQNGDGTSSVVTTSSYEIRFTNPQTGAVETKFLDDIRKSKGDSVALVYDPSDHSIDLNDRPHLLKTPITCFIVLAVLWGIAAAVTFL